MAAAPVKDVSQSRKPKLVLGATSAEAKDAGRNHVFLSMQPEALPTCSLIPKHYVFRILRECADMQNFGKCRLSFKYVKIQLLKRTS